MGTWGVNAMDNDAARDWVGNLVEQDSLDPIVEALRAVLDTEDGYLDSDLGVEALAACEVVARQQGRGVDEDEPDLDAWLSTKPSAPTAQVVELAVAAIDRVVAKDSELAELWEEGGPHPEWRASVQDLRNRLAR